jgi:hypothetical protein
MKVLFLDVDGVINSVRSATAFGGFPWKVDSKEIKLFDNVAISLIRKICKETNTKIVLSSTWRKTVGWKALRDALKLDIIDATPFTFSERMRGVEINEWLEKHPEVTKYVIVDDDTDMLEAQKKNFVRVDSLEGLSYKNYKQILSIIGNEGDIW